MPTINYVSACTEEDLINPIAYLCHLLQETLPTKVTEPRELKLVALLKATELIEAEISAANGAHRGYLSIRAATVTRITDSGMTELRGNALVLVRSMRLRRGKQLTPLEYLASLATASLPTRIDQADAIQKNGLV